MILPVPVNFGSGPGPGTHSNLALLAAAFAQCDSLNPPPDGFPGFLMQRPYSGAAADALAAPTAAIASAATMHSPAILTRLMSILSSV